MYHLTEALRHTFWRRGVLYENTGRFELAQADYRAVLQADPKDPSGWNNLGNVSAAMGKW
jgi:Flp pilus assembly protein TadD